MDWISSPEAWVALATLTILEIVLGIDNIVFISILADNLPEEQRHKARQRGLMLAMGTRILLLFSISLIMSLTQPLFSALGHAVSGRDLILILGGLFLLTKSTREIHDKLEGEVGGDGETHKDVTLGHVLIQIALLDIVFSLDSVITAVGMADDLGVMITAVVLAVGVMMISATPVSAFVSRHPTVKMLALSFLLLIGMSLVAEGAGFHIPKAYVYFAMGFSVFVEALNLRITSKARPVKLRERRHPEIEVPDGICVVEETPPPPA
jgi:predicted tellurium resistance membrane protein TerC